MSKFNAHKLLPLGERLSEHQLERRNAKMTERSRLDSKVNFLGTHYMTLHKKSMRIFKIALGVAAAQLAAIVALAGRVLGAW